MVNILVAAAVRFINISSLWSESKNQRKILN